MGVIHSQILTRASSPRLQHGSLTRMKQFMRPKNRNRRLFIVLLCVVLLGTGVTLLFSALNQYTQFFYDPSEILAEGFTPQSDDIRVGGLVLSGSVVKGEGVLTTFKMGDFVEGASVEPAESDAITVAYEGVLPDLFREGQGVVVTGNLETKTFLKASEVLAKHDENYQPQKEKY